MIIRLAMGAAAAVALVAILHVSGSAARTARSVVERPAVLPRGEHRLGALAGAATLHGAVVLRPRDAAGLRRFIAQTGDPHSARFGDYLAAGAFATRFGPAASTRAAVAAALRGDGLHVGAADGGGLLIPFSGTTADAERAFATQIASVSLRGGATGRATTAPVTLPSTIAASVATVVGLDQTVAPHRVGPAPPRGTGAHGHAPVSASAGAAQSSAGPRACPAARTAARHFNGLTDDQIASAYGADGLYDAGDTGTGQRIAVYELEPFLRSDVKTFDTCFFGAHRAARMLDRLHVHDVDGGPPHGTGSGEASLDVEDLSGLAPGARIDVYVGPSANAYDSLDEYAAIVDADRDRITSTSWGLCEQGVQHGQPGLQEAENLLFEQAAAQGQTIVAAAGDQGSDDCNASRSPQPALGQNPVSVDDPASQPYVLGVGGTAIDNAAASHPLQHVWNDGAVYGAGGGGISMAWGMPSWQRAARLPGIARPGGTAYRAGDSVERRVGYPGGFCNAYGHVAPGTPCRLVPDVSAQADEFTGSITVYSRAYRTKHMKSGWSTAGGTSSAAPIWAASLALINASPACAASSQTRHGIGFASPLLYAVASDPARYAASFDDVRAGNNDLYGLHNGRVFHAGRGYDMATGLGTPRLTDAGGTAGLATYACQLARTANRPLVSGLQPRAGSARGGERLVIHGRGFASGGRSRVAAVQIGTRRIPAGRLHVRGGDTITLTLPPARGSLPPASTPTADGSGAATVLVTLRDGTSSSPGPGAIFRYLHPTRHGLGPTVAAISPTGGPQRPRTAVTILGTGFSQVTAVTFGGVRALHVRAAGPDRIRVLPPPRTRSTRCVALPHHGFYAHDTHGNDICQVHVQVHTRAGQSALARIRAPLQGMQITGPDGSLVAPPGCHCEAAQAPDEFDYVPRPHIDAVSTVNGPTSLASEHGGTVVTVRGSGLDPMTLDNADFGDPRRFSSEANGYVFSTGTVLQIHAPRRSITAHTKRLAFSVRTLGGRSNALRVTYAGIPSISRVVNARNARNRKGVYGGPNTGRTPLVVHGRGMRGQLIGVQFIDRARPPRSVGTQYTFHSHGDRRMTTQTVAQNPAEIAVEACTVTGCTKPGDHNLFWLYPPGDPSVTSVSPDSGPAAGGTAVTIHGHNLGCPFSVGFGGTPATKLYPVKTILPCGSSQVLGARTPAAGTAGETVPVTVQTAESFYTHARQASRAAFSYR